MVYIRLEWMTENIEIISERVQRFSTLINYSTYIFRNHKIVYSLFTFDSEFDNVHFYKVETQRKIWGGEGGVEGGRIRI